MKISSNPNKTKHPTRLVLWLFISSLVYIGLFLFIDYMILGKNFKSISMGVVQNTANEKNNYLKKYADAAKNTISAVRLAKVTNDYLANKEEKLPDLKNFFYEVISSQDQIMQIRYLDASGMEVIRIDRKQPSSVPVITLDRELQNKSNRDYFIKSKTVKDSIWVSNIEPNIEFGQIEFPLKPTYRVVSPINYFGSFEGVFIINYFAQDMLDKLFETSIHDFILVNKDGCILKHYNNRNDWSCFQKQPFKIDDKYLEVFMHSSFSSGDFYSKKLTGEFSGENYLILEPSHKLEQTQSQIVVDRLIKVALILILLSVLINISLYYSLKLFSKDKNEN